jgi:hypothetical protein
MAPQKTAIDLIGAGGTLTLAFFGQLMLHEKQLWISSLRQNMAVPAEP